MKSYGQFCPVAQALEIVGERWTLLVVRELLSGSRRFGEILNGVRRIPRSVLVDRLEQLERSGLVRRSAGAQGNEYTPTHAALALEEIVMGLGAWSRRWAHREIRDDELDPTLLLWDMQRRVDAAAAPAALVVVRFDFQVAEGYTRYWLKLDHGQGEVCLKNPGLEEALVVETTPRALIEVWLGHRDFAAAIRSRAVHVKGLPRLARAFPTWFRLNPFVELAPVSPPARVARSASSRGPRARGRAGSATS